SSSSGSCAASSKLRLRRGLHAQIQPATNSTSSTTVTIPDTISLPPGCVAAKALQVGHHGVEFGPSTDFPCGARDLFVAVWVAQTLQGAHVPGDLLRIHHALVQPRVRGHV